MNETTTEPEIITDKHIVAINAARDALEQIDKAANEAAWKATSNVMEEGPYAASYGAVSALAEVASDALFRLLNHATTRKVVTLQDTQLFNREVER